MSDYQRWSLLKEKLESKPSLPNRFPKEMEVWMTNIGKNIGFEQNGSGANFSRPVVILKKFNNQMFWAIPLTTKQKGFDFYYNFIDSEGKKVAGILAQLKLISVKRLQRKMYEIPLEHFSAIKERIRKLV